jgi:hypothetical protein
MARFVHTPYTWPGADIGEIDTNNCTSTYSCLERVPSIRHWWHTYITGSHVFKFQIDSMGRNPRAVDAVCDELVTHIITVFGAHTGSLSSELVQNAVKRQWPILYELVIGWLFHRRWHDFILQYTNILTLVRVKNNVSNPEWCWRLHQTKHANQWEMVDARRITTTKQFEERVHGAVVGLLSACPMRSCHLMAIVWHITPLLVYEGHHRPMRPVRLLQMVEMRSDLFTTHVDPNGAAIISLA